MRDGDGTAMTDGPRLSLPDSLEGFPASARPLTATLDLALHPGDGMYAADDLHYLECGASALNAILLALQMAEAVRPKTILDFGSGAGRVTRWLRAAFPESAIACCDLRAADLDFCRAHYGAETWVSGTDVAALAAPGRYDLIWVGSVFTHLSADVSRALLAKILGWTKPGGLVVASTMGRTGKMRHERDREFIHPEGWTAIEAGYAATGFGYADYADHVGYGLSLIAPSWWAGTVETTADLRLVLFAERAWDGLHDILAVQNDAGIAAYAPDPESDPRAMSRSRRFGRASRRSNPPPPGGSRRRYGA